MEKYINNLLWSPAPSIQIATLWNLSLSSSRSTRKRSACWWRSVMHKLPHEKHDNQQLLRGRGGRRCRLLGLPQKCPPMYFRAEHRPSLKPCSPATSQYPRTRVTVKSNPPRPPATPQQGHRETRKVSVRLPTTDGTAPPSATDPRPLSARLHRYRPPGQPLARRGRYSP